MGWGFECSTSKARDYPEFYYIVNKTLVFQNLTANKGPDGNESLTNLEASLFFQHLQDTKKRFYT